jgi:hypothetical protein
MENMDAHTIHALFAALATQALSAGSASDPVLADGGVLPGGGTDVAYCLAAAPMFQYGNGGEENGETRLGSEMTSRLPAAEGTSCKHGDGGGDESSPQGWEKQKADESADNGRDKGTAGGWGAGRQEKGKDGGLAQVFEDKADAGEGDGKEAGQQVPQDEGMPSGSLGKEHGMGANRGDGATNDGGKSWDPRGGGGFAAGVGRIEVQGGDSGGGQPLWGREQKRADLPAGQASMVSTAQVSSPHSQSL